MMQPRTYESIPGLFLFPDYFSSSLCATITKETLGLHIRLDETASLQTPEKVHIPQPDFVRSEHHNLGSEEYYTRVVLREEASSRQLRCEYFPQYGDEGHALGYFRGNANIPDFIADDILASVQQSMKELGLIESENDLTWKLTVNIYKNVAGTIAGFPFHVDIPANGVVTMIMNVQREALFQIAKGDLMQDIKLPIGGLLVLSGESRYQWKHRVLPETSGESASEDVERVSLVLGFQ